MYAVAFDLVVADTERYHPKGVPQAYADIGAILAERGFSRVQGSLYVTDDEDMANLFMAMQELRARYWFPKSVRDIRAFRIEQWSDFTSIVKGVSTRPLEVREPETLYAAQRSVASGSSATVKPPPREGIKCRVMQESGHAPPTVSLREGAVVVTFTLPGETLQKTLQKTPAAILRLLKDEANLTTSELAARLGRSRSAIARAMRKLQESGLLVRVGPDKGGHWKVSE